jgi:hypothetical protein
MANPSQPLPLDKLIEINDQLRRDRKIEAIKIYRETFKVGLKEAKDAVEQLERGEAVNLAGNQKIMSFQGTSDQNQMVFNAGTSVANVPGQVVLGGKTAVGQKPGWVSAFLVQFGCLIFLFFWIPFILVMLGPVIYPDLVLLTVPLVCDEGYREAYSERVSYYSAGNFEGNNIVLLHCVYGDGADDVPHPLKVDAILFAGPMALFAVLAFGISLVGAVKNISSA